MLKKLPSTAWKEGKSGNPKGRPPEEESLTWLMKQFLQEIPPGQAKTNKRKFIEKAYAKAVEDGDAASIKLIWNYIDGTPKESIDHTSKGEALSTLPPVINISFTDDRDKNS